MTTRFIAGLAVEVEGEGPPIVCIHGLGGSSNTWTPILGAMREHTVVRIDLPGSARSGAGAEDLSIETMAQCVIAVCTELDIAGAVFVGHSMGTIVCQHVAQHKPSLVKALALFGALPCPPDVARPAIQARAAKARAGGQAAMQEIADAIVQGATSSSTRQGLPLALALIRESLMRQEAVGYARCCTALAHAQSASLEDIQVPVLLVTGDEDAVGPPSTVREMARRLPRARVEILPRCGHWTPFERPAECVALLEAFLRRP